tara:strand:- start:159 stop:377 length:219 start_codon:yes stop_codon:yes gene_type:complete
MRVALTQTEAAIALAVQSSQKAQTKEKSLAHNTLILILLRDNTEHLLADQSTKTHARSSATKLLTFKDRLAR